MKQSHRRLKREGWIRQFVADEPLAKDAVEIYDLLGFEILLQPLGHAQSEKGNPFSFEESQSPLQMVYIRPKRSLNEEEEEWI